MSKTAELIIDGKSYNLPMIVGSEGEVAIDISELRDKAKVITLDLGFKNTGSTKSAITFLDGDKGVLHYRGYSIEDLAEKSNFIEVAYLLIYGSLPTPKELENFRHDIKTHTLVHEDTKKILDGFPSRAHPMGVLASLFCTQTAFYPESLDPNRSAEGVNLSIIRSLAKMPTFAAWAYKNAVGHPVNYPDNRLTYTARFLKMMFSLPAEEYEVDPVVADALDKLLILHADLQRRNRRGQIGDQLFIDLGAGVDAAGRGAVLTGVVVAEHLQARDDVVDVGVVEDDDGGLAAQLQVHPLDVARRGLGHLHAGPHRAGDRHHLRHGVLDQRPADEQCAADDQCSCHGVPAVWVGCAAARVLQSRAARSLDPERWHRREGLCLVRRHTHR